MFLQWDIKFIIKNFSLFDFFPCVRPWWNLESKWMWLFSNFKGNKANTGYKKIFIFQKITTENFSQFKNALLGEEFNKISSSIKQKAHVLSVLILSKANNFFLVTFNNFQLSKLNSLWNLESESYMYYLDTWNMSNHIRFTRSLKSGCFFRLN